MKALVGLQKSVHSYAQLLQPFLRTAFLFCVFFLVALADGAAVPPSSAADPRAGPTRTSAEDRGSFSSANPPRRGSSTSATGGTSADRLRSLASRFSELLSKTPADAKRYLEIYAREVGINDAGLENRFRLRAKGAPSRNFTTAVLRGAADNNNGGHLQTLVENTLLTADQQYVLAQQQPSPPGFMLRSSDILYAHRGGGSHDLSSIFGSWIAHPEILGSELELNSARTNGTVKHLVIDNFLSEDFFQLLARTYPEVRICAVSHAVWDDVGAGGGDVAGDVAWEEVAQRKNFDVGHFGFGPSAVWSDIFSSTFHLTVCRGTGRPMQYVGVSRMLYKCVHTVCSVEAMHAW